jgi:hypothetical protein|tara:strand:+ start:999 stop:1181 length:183 start_codon:yes stop_codon:yes gene_type:complete
MLSSIITPLDNCNTGTVPLGEISYKDWGRSLKKTSRISTSMFEFAIASLARMANGQRRNE